MARRVRPLRVHRSATHRYRLHARTLTPQRESPLRPGIHHCHRPLQRLAVAVQRLPEGGNAPTTRVSSWADYVRPEITRHIGTSYEMAE